MGELGVGGNYARCFIIVTIFMRFGGAKRLGPVLMGEVDRSRHHDLASLPKLCLLISAWVSSIAS